MHKTTTHRRRQAFYALPQSHWQRLAAPPISYLDTLSTIDDAIDVNANFADVIYEAGIEGLGAAFIAADPAVDDAGEGHARGAKPAWYGRARELDLQNARSTINQFYRDWSVEGGGEREACYGPIYRDVETFAPSSARLLVPGAGLGRLVLELAARGYEVEGNEVSYHQLLASDVILNKSTRVEEWTIYPFVGQFSNRLRRADQLRAVTVPDIVPSVHLAEAWGRAEAQRRRRGRMGMSMGDFVEVYQREEYRNTFDAVVSVFFIDTAPNVVEYITVVREVLKLGGVWCNVGPLLWHFDGGKEADKDDKGQEAVVEEGKYGVSAGASERTNAKIGSRGSVELTNEEVLEVLHQFGFEIIISEECSDDKTTGYIEDPTTMLQHMYKPVHWVARLTQ